MRDNSHLTAINEYDLLDNLIRSCAESGGFDVPVAQFTCAGLPESEFVTTEYEYDQGKNLTWIRFGEAVEGRQPNNVVRLLYDERDLVYQVTPAAGDAGQSTTQYDYDRNGNIARLTRGSKTCHA
ncbi:MAG: hypothetical protein KAY37_03385 [Phycisphaerae bacterium]|nr:hypothetical protein [Phycisphaerae bacterium]